MPPTIVFVIIGLIVVNALIQAKKKGGAQPPQRPVAQDPTMLNDAQRQVAARPPVRLPMQSADVSSWHWRCSCGNDNAPGAQYCTRCGRNAAQVESGSLAYNSTEGMSAMGDMEGLSTEGRGSSALVAVKSSLQHVVRASSESSHTHVETSMTGVEEYCPEESAFALGETNQPQESDAYALGTTTRALPYGIELGGARAIVRGVLYAEILGKPKALRR